MPYREVNYAAGVQWDQTGPYYLYADGGKMYIPPVIAGTYHDDPRLMEWAASHGVTAENPSGNVPTGGFLHGRGEWNNETGQYEQPINWGNLASVGVGAGIAAPFVVGALGAGAAGGGAGAGTGSAATGAAAGTGVGIGETGATVGLASGAGLPGAVAAPTALGAGTGTAAAGTGATAAKTGLSGRDWMQMASAGASMIPAAMGGEGDVSGAINKLSSAADRSTKTGQSLATQGADLLGPVQEYLKAITGGDRQALMQATMPERRRVIDQYATAKKAIAEFTPRGGGQAGAMAQLQSQQAGDLAETTATARQKGLTTAGTLGGQLTTLGLSADALASGDLNSIINALTKQDETKSDKWAAIGQGLGTMAGYYFGRGA